MLEVALGFHHEMKVVQSIIRVDGESDKEVEKRCQAYQSLNIGWKVIQNEETNYCIGYGIGVGIKGGDQMKSLSVKLGVILIGLIIFSYAEVWGADWVFLAAESDGTLWWIDIQGITVHPNKILTMWVKKIKAKDILEIIKSGTKINPSELEKMVSERAYERSFMEIDCIKKTFNNLQIFNYDSKSVLKSGVTESNIKNIPPGSVVETIYKAVCK